MLMVNYKLYATHHLVQIITNKLRYFIIKQLEIGAGRSTKGSNYYTINNIFDKNIYQTTFSKIPSTLVIAQIYFLLFC